MTDVMKPTDIVFDLSGLLDEVSRLFVGGEEDHLSGSVAWRVADEAAV